MLIGKGRKWGGGGGEGKIRAMDQIGFNPSQNRSLHSTSPRTITTMTFLDHSITTDNLVKPPFVSQCESSPRAPSPFPKTPNQPNSPPPPPPQPFNSLQSLPPIHFIPTTSTLTTVDCIGHVLMNQLIRLGKIGQGIWVLTEISNSLGHYSSRPACHFYPVVIIAIVT